MKNQSLIRLLAPFTLALLWGSAGATLDQVHERVAWGVLLYEDGKYQESIDSLSTLLPLVLDTADQIRAYQFIGFSYAMLKMIENAKSSFKTGLSMYPDMRIDSLEVPPDIALIFEQALLETRLQKSESAHQDLAALRQPVDFTLPVLSLVLAISSAGGGGYFVYRGYTLHKKYLSINTPDQSKLNDYYNQSRNAYIAGAVFTGIAAVILPVSIHLFVKKHHAKGSVTLLPAGNGLSMDLYF